MSQKNSHWCQRLSKGPSYSRRAQCLMPSLLVLFLLCPSLLSFPFSLPLSPFSCPCCLTGSSIVSGCTPPLPGYLHPSTGHLPCYLWHSTLNSFSCFFLPWFINAWWLCASHFFSSPRRNIFDIYLTFVSNFWLVGPEWHARTICSISNLLDHW